jgi:hypothetical protein
MSVVQHFINKTKTDNECVPDNIVNEIIKFNSSVTLKSYTKLLNKIIKYAVIPQCETVREINLCTYSPKRVKYFLKVNKASMYVYCSLFILKVFIN